MTTLTKRLALAGAGFILTVLALSAQAPAPGLQTATPNREHRLEKRAERQPKRLAQADGRITKQEAATIELEQHQASQRLRLCAPARKASG